MYKTVSLNAWIALYKRHCCCCYYSL